MEYVWWKFVHLVGVFGFLIAHGVSIGAAFRLRQERDPARVLALLQLSGSSVTSFYASLVLLVLSGVVTGFLGQWWSHRWIWASIATLVVTMVAMYALARPYYRKIRLVAGAMAEGSKAVSEEQFAALLTSPRLLIVSAVGFAGLGFILLLMVVKPFETF